MTTPDYSTWLPKADAATAIGVSTKTIEQLTKDGKLEQARYRRPDGGPELAVYNPDDVARMAATRRPARPAFVLPAVTTPANGNGQARRHPDAIQALSSVSVASPGDDPIRQLFAAALRAVLAQSSATSQSSQKSETVYVTVKEAAAILGLPQVDVRVLIHEGDLLCRYTRRGGIRIRRRDLEAL